MRPTVVATLVIVTAIIGIVVGTFVGRDTAPITATPSSDRTDAAPSASARAADPSSPRDDEPSARRMRRERRDADPRASSDASDEREQDRSETADPSAPTSDIDTLTRELAALKRENAELREEHAELLGEPLPPRADVEPRFSGPSLTASVGQAIDQAGVVGKVEHVDCSEYPCITFGRLAGDEEDMEERARRSAVAVRRRRAHAALLGDVGRLVRGVRSEGDGAVRARVLHAGRSCDRRCRARSADPCAHRGVLEHRQACEAARSSARLLAAFDAISPPRSARTRARGACG